MADHIRLSEFDLKYNSETTDYDRAKLRISVDGRLFTVIATADSVEYVEDSYRDAKSMKRRGVTEEDLREYGRKAYDRLNEVDLIDGDLQ